MASLSNPHFRVSPSVLAPLGAEQLQDPALAILELVKNAWDADATRVVINVEQRSGRGSIAVLDNGHGMTQAEFADRWLIIGASYKRERETSESGRPLIGEKGLGRLSSFALGGALSIRSGRRGKPAFVASVNWEALAAAKSLEDYAVDIAAARRTRGTRVVITKLRSEWKSVHTEFLVSHAEFLASVPGQKLSVVLRVNGKRYSVQDPVSTVSRLAEASLDMHVMPDGVPRVITCKVNGVDESDILFRDIPKDEVDARLAGMRVSLKFFRRDEATRRLGNVLERNEVRDVLERYQGVRIYRDGINVPPYGLNGDDWAALEKQRTSTGGPTLVPGNSQLVGEVHLSRKRQPHFVVTAGRSGFTDQTSVASMANYVRWAVRNLGTARRAEQLGIRSRSEQVPARVEVEPKRDRPEQAARIALDRVSRARLVRTDPELRETLSAASTAVNTALDLAEESLRLYAQLASTGVAATSFAHELRTEFDVVSEAIDEMARSRGRPERELLDLLSTSWKRISAFAALFKVVPVKLRRQRKTLSAVEIKNSITTILGLAPPDKVQTEVVVPQLSLSMVPAELDSLIVNLVSNAVKAIAESANREQGRIRVCLETQAPDLSIRVADNGCGISPKVAAVMFEPLEGRFSEGTGMGLPIAKFIAERYGGRVFVSPTPPARYVTDMVVQLKKVVQ
jgi:signal transduction histidine kinase